MKFDVYIYCELDNFEILFLIQQTTRWLYVYSSCSFVNIQLNPINKHKHYLLCQLISTTDCDPSASDDQFYIIIFFILFKLCSQSFTFIIDDSIVN